MNPENVPRQLGRIQLHIIPRPVPQVARAGQQILCLIAAIPRNLQLIQRQVTNPLCV
jgi:hypothetical protein